jgi:hypothetical protein
MDDAPKNQGYNSPLIFRIGGLTIKETISITAQYLKSLNLYNML